jgi:hypothetical protein
MVEIHFLWPKIIRPVENPMAETILLAAAIQRRLAVRKLRRR